MARKVTACKKDVPPGSNGGSTQSPFTGAGWRFVYAPEVVFSADSSRARDAENRQGRLVNWYGMVGAGRDNPADRGGGNELYVVKGHCPRHLRSQCKAARPGVCEAWSCSPLAAR